MSTICAEHLCYRPAYDALMNELARTARIGGSSRKGKAAKAGNKPGGLAAQLRLLRSEQLGEDSDESSADGDEGESADADEGVITSEEAASEDGSGSGREGSDEERGARRAHSSLPPAANRGGRAEAPHTSNPDHAADGEDESSGSEDTREQAAGAGAGTGGGGAGTASADSWAAHVGRQLSEEQIAALESGKVRRGS
jgi:hypothetical protein